jgi:cytochrome bd ubiquinol oxidase subunit II
MWAQRLWLVVLPLWLAVTVATAQLRPETFTNVLARPWLLGFVVLMLGGVGGVFRFLRRGRELASFLSSSAFLLGLLAATMAGIYPIWLRSTINPAYNLTAENSAAKSYGLQVALVWWVIGIMLAAAYFVNLFRSNRGKVDVRTEGHSYEVVRCSISTGIAAQSVPQRGHRIANGWRQEVPTEP